jgi:hypothetical protein
MHESAFFAGRCENRERTVTRNGWMSYILSSARRLAGRSTEDQAPKYFPTGKLNMKGRNQEMI